MPFKVILPKLRLLLLLGLLCPSPAFAAADAALLQSIYRNAFLAARDGDYASVMQHWYLFSSLDRPQLPGPLEPAFQSLLWASVNKLDLCPQNLSLDSDGDQLWSLVLHNYIVRHRRDPTPSSRSLIEGVEAFSLGYQQRRIAFDDILSMDEMKNLQTRSFGCSAMNQSDKLLKATVRFTPEKRRLSLLLAFLQKARQVWSQGDEALLLDMRIYAVQIVLQEADTDPDRHRAFVESIGELFGARIDDETKQYIPQLIVDSDLSEKQQLRLLMLWLDQAIAQEEGPQIGRLISLIEEVDPTSRPAVWSGERGRLLLELGKRDIFTEAPTVALYRAIAAFHAGEPVEALRLFALCLSLKASNPDQPQLAMKWIKYILLQYRFENRLMQFLREYLPRPVFRSMTQDLLWTSVFYRETFLLSNPATQDLLNNRLQSLKDKLLLIAKGKDTEILRQLKMELKSNPRAAMGFMKQMTEQLSHQSNDLIQRFLPLVRAMNSLLDDLDPKLRSKKNQTELYAQFDALLMQGEQLSSQQRDRQLRTEPTVSLGTVALEPSVTPPWPFPKATRIQLSVYKEIQLAAELVKAKESTREYIWTIGER